MASIDVLENGAETSSVQAIADTLSKTSISDGGDTNRKIEKDPRIIARKYQMDLCKKAVCENTIAYLGTGCGKTHIAVLLIYEMRHLIKKPQNKICVFLAPTVALVEQQAKVIEDSIDVEVGTYCGSKQMKGHKGWEKELEQHEVLVMTPQILLHCLSHCCIRTELIALLIFDECHYAQVDSNHPYAEIMKVFYNDDNAISPRIFGMTASPILGKGASISGLETLLRSKVYSVEDKEELELFVTSPKFTVYYYATAVDSTSCPLNIIYNKLEKIKSQCVSDLSSDPSSSRSTKKTLQSLHINLCFCIEKLGLWGALQAAHILLRGDPLVRDELVEMEEQSIDDPICDKYLTQAAIMLVSYCMEEDTQAKLNSLQVLEEPFFSQKLLKLIYILSNFRLQPNMKCIIFVNRIVTARSLSSILQNLKVLSAWKCDFLVGVHSGVKCVSRKSTNAMLEKFRSGELNLLVATKVGEEGLDIQTCCLVIRFDLPETVASFIQSRGRARMSQSEYALLVDRDDDRELNLIRSFTEEEDKMNQEIECRTSTATFGDLEEKTYKVESKGATISSGYSISLLHRYCSKLTHDEFFHPKPQFSYFDDADGIVCQIILPSNAPIHLVSSSPQTSKDGAKRDACLQACRNLHQLGALTDYLLPEQDDENEDMLQYSSDSDCSDDEDTRKELHEMLVPAVLQEQWSKTENYVQLSSYFVKFRPHPEDRDYKPFGLFVKVSLPGEAEKMKLDLHLVRGRSVVAELIPSRAMPFSRDEIVLAEKFQEMFLKVIIDRSDFISEYVPLGINDYGSLASRTCYLMLPVIWCEYEEAMTIDWKLVRRCLSSPIFRMPEVAEGDGLPQPSKQLHLANGRKNIHDVVNSLIYVPRKDIFYFIADVVLEKNALSEYKRSTSHIQHYSEKFGIDLLHPSQPLLKAKQLFRLDNLLRKKGHLDSREKEEHFVELPPEICQLKIIGFSKDIGSSLSLLPSIMHRLENLLVAVELKHVFSASFPEGAEVTASRVLEALTTEKCNEHFSLERLEVLGDAFLKFAVGRRLFLLHEALDEGQLTRKRSNVVNNTNLLKLATTNNLQVYIRDQSFNPKHFFTLGRPCSVVCSVETQKSLHPPCGVDDCADIELRCNKSHHWLHKKTIADVVEALVGAFIVDSGFKAATAFLKWMGIQVEFEVSRVSHICSASAIYLPLADRIDISALENSIGYHFANKGLLVQAFVHPSYNFHSGGCYQRLEFLGDAVLDYLITSYLYSVYPNLKPGQLTDLRSTCVNNNCFADIAINRSFYKFIIYDSVGLCNAMDKYVKFARTPQLDGDEVEAPACPKVLGDLVESCVGAILLDTGFDLNRVWKTMLSFLDPVINFSRLQLNPIRELHELCQSHDMDIDFASSKKDTTFSVEVKVNGKGVSECCFASNFNKKAAKIEAVKQVISKLKEQGYKPKSKSLEEVLKSTQKMEAELIGYNEESSSYNEISSNVSSSHGNETNNLKVQDCYQSCASPKLATGTNKLMVQDSYQSCASPKVATGTNNLMVQDSYQSCASPKVATGTNNLKVQDSYQSCASPKVTSGTNNLKVQDSYQSCASLKLATGTNNLKIQDSYKTCASPKLAHVTGTNNLKVQDSYKSCASSKVHPLGIEPNRSGDAEIKPVRRTSYPNVSQERQLAVNDNTNSCSSGTQTSGGSIKKTSKSRLYEICAANCWKPPVFECYKETGESHLKEFTFKVTVVPDGLDSVVAIGRPAGRKKEAAEIAAEGAVWYLYKSNTIRS